MKTTIKVKFTDGTTDVYYHDDDWAERTRPELFGQPRLSGLNGPMWNGWGVLKSTGETVTIIRYEKPSKY